MDKIEKFGTFGKVSISKDERKYLFTKMEYKKRKSSTEKEDEIYLYLNGEVDSTTEDFFIKILNTLEYTFKNKLKSGTMNTDMFKSIQAKLPSEWVGVKYSRIDTNKNREDRKSRKDSNE